ncbi:hypothetical protein [Actinoallomurus sp. CA-150999]|uniref:hypothetical protein n=1 Tax=Actinoallomurus sp. CA-150999 TaxID=3239887 RepID=UPI003D8EACED
MTVGVGSTLGGRDLMQTHVAARAALGRLDNLYGAPTVYAQALRQHRQVLTWHATVRTSAQRRQIAALAADTGGFVAFLANDMGATRAGITHYSDAISYAQQAGDLSSWVALRGQLSRVLADQGRDQDALALADAAVRRAGTQAHPAVRSWLHAVRAHHHACQGDVRAAQTDLAMAWALLERADDGEVPAYIGFLDAAELWKWTGHVTVALLRRDEVSPSVLRAGETALEQARVAWPASAVRGSAEMLTASARVRAAGRDLDLAAALASRSVTVARQTGSARNLRAALTTRAVIVEPRPRPVLFL